MGEMEYRYNIGDTFSFGDVSYTVIDRKIVTSDSKWRKKIKKYLCECSKCHSLTWKDEKYINRATKENGCTKGVGCSVCRNRYRVEVGVNDVATLRPDLIKYFVDPEDAKRYSIMSGQRVRLKCPICGFEKNIELHQLTRDGKFVCPSCDDGVSFPNKIGYNVLKQLGVDNLQTEYNSSWTNGMRYDFAFSINSNIYLLEMDGELHYKSGFWKDPSVVQNRDKLKDKLAAENNCTLIRIDCMKSDFEYIKNNLINSQLSELFDMNSIDWDYVYESSMKSRIIEVWDDYNNGCQDIKELAAKYDVCTATIIVYLKKGAELGKVDYKTNHKKKELNYQNFLDIVKLHPEYTIKQYAEQLNVNEWQVRAYKREAIKNAINIDPRNDLQKRHDYMLEVVANNYALTNRELAKIAGCNPVTIKGLRDELQRVS